MFIGRGGQADIAVAANQSIIVASYGPGSTEVWYQSSTTNNVPAIFYRQAVQSGGATTYGPFTSATTVRVIASVGCDVEVAVGSTPQLTQANPANMPTLQMGANQRILESAQDALTAKAGGGQSGATLLSCDINRVTTVSSANDSCLLPAALPGMNITVTNATATNSMNVFPATGEIINALSANAAFGVAAAKTATFSCAKAGQWHSVLSA